MDEMERKPILHIKYKYRNYILLFTTLIVMILTLLLGISKIIENKISIIGYFFLIFGLIMIFFVWNLSISQVRQIFVYTDQIKFLGINIPPSLIGNEISINFIDIDYIDMKKDSIHFFIKKNRLKFGYTLIPIPISNIFD